MRLRYLQIGLWIAAIAAMAAVGTARWADRTDPGTEQAFRPVFALPDGAGRVRSSEEFRGRFMLVFFGFTTCPDICPTTLSEVAQVMDDLGTDAAQVQPIFISVDPERDRRLGIDAFTQAFHPAILGLAGDEATTRAAADSFKIFYEREADAKAPDGYAMAHSPALYLIGPEGDWLRQFPFGTPAAEILADLKARL